MSTGLVCTVVLELCSPEEELNGVTEPSTIWWDTEGPPLRITLCARGGGVLLSVRGMACFECGKMLCSSTVIKRMSAAFSSDALRLKLEETQTHFMTISVTKIQKFNI